MRAPATEKSRKQNQRAVDELLKAAKLHVVETLVPRVRVDFERALTEPFILDTEESASESKVFFRYPKALGDTAYGSAHAYINPAVLLELGARADHYPTRQVAIAPYAAIEFPTSSRIQRAWSSRRRRNARCSRRP